MKKAKVLMSPSIGLNGIILSAESQYSGVPKHENTSTLYQCM